MNSEHVETRPASESRKLRAALRIMLVVSIVFTALAHGAVEPWSVYLFEVLILFIVAIWIAVCARERRLLIEVPGAALPLVALFAVGLLQSIAFTGASGALRSLSKNVEATRSTVMVVGSMLVALLASVTFFNDRRRIWRVVHFLIFFGMALALFGFIQHYTWNGKLYWVRPIGQSPSPFGPFVNHSNFAGYMELLIGLPVGLIITRAVRGEKAVLFGFAAATMAIATVASLSRGGMVSMFAEMVFLAAVAAVVLKRRKSHRHQEYIDVGTRSRRRLASGFARAALGLVVIAAIGIVGLYWVGPERLMERLTKGQLVSSDVKKETLYSSRGWVWEDTLKMIGDNPVLGVGIGAYGTAFPIYTGSNGAVRVLQAHNDYLQVLSDCGVVGGILAIWFLVVIFKLMMAGVRSDDSVLSGLAIGSSAGVFAILVHSIFDFNLQLPSNALLFLFLIAILSCVVGMTARTDRPAVPAIQGSGPRRALSAKATIGR